MRRALVRADLLQLTAIQYIVSIRLHSARIVIQPSDIASQCQAVRTVAAFHC